MLTLKRILIPILVSACALTTFVASPASAEDYSYNCGQNFWGWFSNNYGGDYGPSMQIPFNLSSGEATGSTISIRSNGRVTDGVTDIRAADTRYYTPAYGWYEFNYYQYRYGNIRYGATANTLCVSWYFYNVNGGRTTTLRLARHGSGTISASVEGFWNHWTGDSYPTVNGQRFDTSFVISGGRSYPYAAVPASINSGSAVANAITLGYTLPADNQDNTATDYDLQYRKVGVDWQEFVHDPAFDGAATVSGLEYLTNYEFRIASVTASGLGPWSDVYAISTTSRPASAPTISDYITSSKSVELKIQDPAIIGDVSLTDYEYSTDDGSTWISFRTATGPFIISSLANATTYPIRVRAINTAGAGDASEPISAMPTRMVPATPQTQLVSVGNQTATLSIDIPSDDTAKSVTGYQYNVNKGTAWKQCVIVDRACAIGGLTNGAKSKLRIRAVNFNGFSNGSTIVEVVSRTTPQAPTIKSVVTRTRSLNIYYLPPADNGGNVPTSYEYSIDSGATWTPSTSKLLGPIEVSGLANATSYDVSVRAINDAGTGLPSRIVTGKTPAVLANQPTITSLVSTQNSISVDFNAPTDNGGAPITNYAYSLDLGRTWKVLPVPSVETHIVIANLAPNKAYGLRLLAINSVGRGAASIAELVRTLH